jgi:mRNA-degrading endonuclease RelE of RelBE toxin-antitoxin system
MTWRLEFVPEVEADISEAADWYEARQPGLARFVKEVIQIWDELTVNSLLGCRRHPTKNIRWRYLENFPYRTIYEVDELNHVVIVAAVLHAARHTYHWQKRVKS